MMTASRRSSVSDPYSEWLGIAGPRRPPRPHQLLGVPAGERGAAVLEEAALRRMAQLRPYQVVHPDECSRLLNEVARALIVLLGRPPRVPA